MPRATLKSSAFHSSPFCPCPRCHCCLTNIDCIAPVHPWLRYPPRYLPLNRILLPSNHPQQTHLLHQSFTKRGALSLREWSLLFTIQETCTDPIMKFFVKRPFPHTLHRYFICSNISLITSVTEVTRVRFFKVQITSSRFFSNGWKWAQQYP
jgi:hypothetical protein